MAKIKKEYRVVVAYDGYDGDFDAKLEALAGKCSGSGYGFGQRDMSWYFRSKAAAIEAARKLKCLSRLSEVTVRCIDGDESHPVAF